MAPLRWLAEKLWTYRNRRKSITSWKFTVFPLVIQETWVLTSLVKIWVKFSQSFSTSLTNLPTLTFFRNIQIFSSFHFFFIIIIKTQKFSLHFNTQTDTLVSIHPIHTKRYYKLPNFWKKKGKSKKKHKNLYSIKNKCVTQSESIFVIWQAKNWDNEIEKLKWKM